MGCLLGAVMSMSNLFVGLKTGWGPRGSNNSLHSLIHPWRCSPAHRGPELQPLDSRKQLHAVRRPVRPDTPTGSTMVSCGKRPAPHSGPSHAFLDINGMDTPAPRTWRFPGDSDEEADDKHRAAPFPQRTCSRRDPAFALRQRERRPSRKAKSLGICRCFLVGMAAFLRDNTLSWWPGYLKLPGMVEFPGRLAAHSLASWTISFEFSAIMVAAVR